MCEWRVICREEGQAIHQEYTHLQLAVDLCHDRTQGEMTAESFKGTLLVLNPCPVSLAEKIHQEKVNQVHCSGGGWRNLLLFSDSSRIFG